MSVCACFVFVFAQTPRNKGGLGKLEMPLLSDVTKSIAKAYGVLVDEGADAGVALRGLFIVDPKGVLRQSTINDLPVGRNVDEALRLVQAFQVRRVIAGGGAVSFTHTCICVCMVPWS